MKSRITLNPVVLAQGKRADGSYNVKIRLTYKRVSRILPTQLTAAAVDVTKTKPVHIKAGTNVLLRAQELIKEMYTALSGLEYAALEYMEVDDVARYLSRKIHEGTAAFRLDFFDWAERYAATKVRTPWIYRKLLPPLSAALSTLLTRSRYSPGGLRKRRTGGRKRRGRTLAIPAGCKLSTTLQRTPLTTKTPG